MESLTTLLAGCWARHHDDVDREDPAAVLARHLGLTIVPPVRAVPATGDPAAATDADVTSVDRLTAPGIRRPLMVYRLVGTDRQALTVGVWTCTPTLDHVEIQQVAAFIGDVAHDQQLDALVLQETGAHQRALADLPGWQVVAWPNHPGGQHQTILVRSGEARITARGVTKVSGRSLLRPLVRRDPAYTVWALLDGWLLVASTDLLEVDDTTVRAHVRFVRRHRVDYLRTGLLRSEIPED